MRLTDVVWVKDPYRFQKQALVRDLSGKRAIVRQTAIDQAHNRFTIVTAVEGSCLTRTHLSPLELACWLADKEP